MRLGSHSTKNAFTLIEVVIAITIVAIMTTIIFSAVSKISRVKQTLDDQRDAAMIANALLTRLTAELQRITTDEKLMPLKSQLDMPFPANTHVYGQNQKLASDTQADEITFVAKDANQYIPNQAALSGVVQIRYFVAQDPDRRSSTTDGAPIYSLIRHEAPVLNDPQVAYQHELIFPITHQLAGLNFRYLNRDEARWEDEWDRGKGQLPDVIALTVKIRSPLGRLFSYMTSVPVKSN